MKIRYKTQPHPWLGMFISEEINIYIEAGDTERLTNLLKNKYKLELSDANYPDKCHIGFEKSCGDTYIGGFPPGHGWKKGVENRPFISSKLVV